MFLAFILALVALVFVSIATFFVFKAYYFPYPYSLRHMLARDHAHFIRLELVIGTDDWKPLLSGRNRYFSLISVSSNTDGDLKATFVIQPTRRVANFLFRNGGERIEFFRENKKHKILSPKTRSWSHARDILSLFQKIFKEFEKQENVPEKKASKISLKKKGVVQ